MHVFNRHPSSHLVDAELMREVFPSDGWEQIGNEMVISQILRVQINALHVIGREITLQL